MPKDRPNNGEIWKVVSGFHAPKHGAKPGEREMWVSAGELVEFRFWHPCNFRTTDGLYLTVSEDTWKSCCEYVGRVFHDVQWRNQNTTKEIVDARLYHEGK